MKKSSKTLVFSAVGVVAMFFILIAINVIAQFFKVRADLTAEHSFTLTPGTRTILSKIDMPVQIRLYVSRGPEMPVNLRSYVSEIEDMLEEFHQVCPQIEVQKLAPDPDSEAEDSAKLEGIEGQPLRNGEFVYLGLSVNQFDRKVIVPFLPLERKQLLEYDITRAIAQVITDKKTVVGILSPLPVLGEMAPPMLMMMGQTQPEWAFVSELKRQFDVREVPFASDSIPQEVQVLVLVQPENISEVTQYAVDQFLLRGGKVVAFLDPCCVFSRSSNPMGGGPPSSTLDKLLPAWGVQFDTSRVVADLDFMAMTQTGREPAVLQLSDQAFDNNNAVTNGIDNMLLLYVGTFQGNPAEGLKRTVLVKSSKHSQLVTPSMADLTPEPLINAFQSSGIEYPLAISLTGKFKTAFPKGKPAPANSDKPNPPKTSSDAPPLKESTVESSVILVADADFIQDRAAIAQLPNSRGQNVIVPANGNLHLGLNAVEQLGGDKNLISARSRTSRERPFTVVREMQTEARRQYQSTIQQLEEELRQTETKLNQLQQSKTNQQKLILSPEQQKELANFQKKQSELRQQLKQVRRDLAQGIDSIEIWLKWINIGLMPMLVAIVGIIFFLIKRQRAARR